MPKFVVFFLNGRILTSNWFTATIVETAPLHSTNN